MLTMSDPNVQTANHYDRYERLALSHAPALDRLSADLAKPDPHDAVLKMQAEHAIREYE